MSQEVDELDPRFNSMDSFSSEGIFSEDDSSDGSDDDEYIKRMTNINLLSSYKHDIPAEYWQLQKLLKYLKGATPNIITAVLACINDLNLETEFMQLALCEGNILQILINLLSCVREFRCRKISLMILSKATNHKVVQHAVTSLGIVPLVVDILTNPARDLQKLAAIVIANVAKLRRSSRLVRESGGIQILVHLLDLERSMLSRRKGKMSGDEIERLDVASEAARALWSLSDSDVNKDLMRAAGIIGLMPTLLQSRHRDLVVRTMGILQNCGNIPEFQMAIYNLDLVKDIVRLLDLDSVELKVLCAMAFFKHAEDERIRTLVLKHGGLTPLVRVLQQEATRKNTELLAAVTGAVWKLAISEENVRHFETVGTIEALVKLLDLDEETVLVHVTGALAECGKLGHNAVAIKRAGGIPPLVALLNRTHQPLLANTAHVLGECAWELECMAAMEEQDAVRLIWSLLKNPSAKVQANAAWALVPCIRNATESGEMVRNFVGGIELVVRRLGSRDRRVVACTCAALTQLAADHENLAVVSDLGVVPVLARLCHDTGGDQFLQEHVAAAVARCCSWGRNCHEFGRLGVVAPLVGFLYHSGRRVRSTAVQALSNLSEDPFNCIALHQSGVVPSLLEAVGSRDLAEQRAAAKCLRNIRRLALSADRRRMEERVRRRSGHATLRKSDPHHLSHVSFDIDAHGSL